MLDMLPTTHTLPALLVAARGDERQLRELGAACCHAGIALPHALTALPGDGHAPRAAAALAEGYLATQRDQEGHHLPRVQDELARRRAELTALHRVNEVATSSLDEAVILDKVVAAVAEVMGVDVCSIYLTCGPSQLVLRATYGLAVTAVGAAQLSIGEGVTGWVAQHRRTAALADLWSDTRAKYLPETAEEAYHAILSVPIIGSGGETVLGVLNVQTREQRDFDEHEVSFLEMVAGELGLSIANARSYDQTDAQLRQKMNALTTLHQVVVAVSSSLDLGRVLNTIARQAVVLCQGQASAIFARRGQGSQLRVDARCDDGELPHLERVTAVALEAIAQARHQVTELPQGPNGAGWTVLCVPLRGHSSTYGALAVYSRPNESFDPETIDLVTDFACEAALAVENAQLHQATQQNLEAKSVLLSELHHRVKNNLQTVAALLSLALRHTKSEEAESTLRESYNRVRSIAAAHDLLSRQAIGVTTIGEVARKVIELLEPTVQGRTAIRFLNDGEAIEVETREATTLAILINELLTNAVRHGLKGRESGVVRVSYGRQGSQVWVTVADDGNGLPPDFTLARNKGLGLSIVRTLVEADLHGQVDWAGNSGGGARFTLLFCPPAQGAHLAKAAAERR